MSTRLQIVIDEKELREIRQAARRAGVTVSEWARAAMRQARRAAPAGDPVRKLAVVEAAASHSFPAAEIETMLAEIESGYVGRAP